MCRKYGRHTMSRQFFKHLRDDEFLLRWKERSKRSALHLIFGRTTLVAVLLALQIFLLVGAFGYLEEYMAYFYGGFAVISGLVVFHLVNQRGDPTVKLTWIVLVMAVPVVGVALYFFVQTDLGHRMIHRRLEKLHRDSAVYVLRQESLIRKLEKEEPEFASLAKYSTSLGYPPYEGCEAEYFPLGDDMFPRLLEELEKARSFIFLEFFIVDEGLMWGKVLDVLQRKVRQGVEVRLLYDGTCALFNLPYHYPREMRELGIQCKMFSPIRPIVSTSYNNRDHRKIVVIDGHTAFTGGVNLADEYINVRFRFGHWKDTAVLIRGAAVRSFTHMFLEMWNVDQRQEDFQRYLNVSCPPLPDSGYVMPYADSPLDDERVGELVYMDMLNRAHRYVHIMTPYLILDHDMITALTFAAKRGVEVVLILPHVPDKKYAFALAKTHYRELLNAGVQIWEYTPGFVHAKVFVSDDKKAVVGTINLDYRSLSLHFECAAYLCGVPAVADIERDVQNTLKRCQRINLAALKQTPFLTRLAGWLLKLLAPLM